MKALVHLIVEAGLTIGEGAGLHAICELRSFTLSLSGVSWHMQQAVLDLDVCKARCLDSRVAMGQNNYVLKCLAGNHPANGRPRILKALLLPQQTCEFLVQVSRHQSLGAGGSTRSSTDGSACAKV